MSQWFHKSSAAEASESVYMWKRGNAFAVNDVVNSTLGLQKRTDKNIQMIRELAECCLAILKY